MYWTDWNREAPKIETSSLDGAGRRILISKDIGLPNGLTFDTVSEMLCWADAGNATGGQEVALCASGCEKQYFVMVFIINQGFAF